jgi:DNA invertase Pin-like site-specific DNA recombinase
MAAKGGGTMAVYGYARCSTAKDKQDIERQIRELNALGAGEVFHEYLSGADANKPQLEKLLTKLQAGDTIAATEVSRLARNVHQLCHFEEMARRCKVKLQCGALLLDYTADKVDPMNRAMFYMMGTFAELERGVTVERIVSGMANAKEKGATMGRPRKTVDEIPQLVKELLPDYKSGTFGIAEYARRAGVSRPSLYKYLRMMEVERVKPTSQKMTIVPDAVAELYAEYEAGNISQMEIVRRTGITPKTIRKYLRILSQG